jgi:hypothetical protein
MSLGDAQTVAFTGTTASSTAFGAKTRIIRVYATHLCHIIAGGASATTSHTPLPPGVSEYFAVAGGSTLAVIRNTSDGTLYITEE